MKSIEASTEYVAAQIGIMALNKLYSRILLAEEPITEMFLSKGGARNKDHLTSKNIPNENFTNFHVLVNLYREGF